MSTKLFLEIYFAHLYSSAGEESACSAGDADSIPGLGRSPGRDRLPTPVFLSFPSDSDGKESTCNVGYLGSITGLGRSPGGQHGKPMDRGAGRL